MITTEEILQLDPFSLGRDQKRAMLEEQLSQLTQHHISGSPLYARMVESLGFNSKKKHQLEAYPFLPVRLFKQLALKSVPDQDIVKTMHSSGTTGQAVSRIYLDSITAKLQMKALVQIVGSFTGKQRLPVLIIDSPAVITDRLQFSARGAGILGFSLFATQKCYALDENMQPDFERIREFLSTHAQDRILVFGFTFMIWQHLLLPAQQQQVRIDLSNAVLIHGGGWKKLKDQAVSAEAFRASLAQAFGITDIHDYYGMVEQTGSVFMECSEHVLHAPVSGDVIIRRASDFSAATIGESGIIQSISILPNSYPGHSLLTEDAGMILGEDDCACGRKGKYFTITGRIPRAEIRGCSDTYAVSH